MRFSRHDASAAARYADVKQQASAQRRVLPGTPGTLKQRTRRGTTYWVREYIRADGRKHDEHLGTVAAVKPSRLEDARSELALAQALAAGSSVLRLLGYQRVERKTAAVLAALFNRGVLQAGLVLVGSHAYGALLNELGIRAAAYRTQDVDLARSRPLKLALPADLPFGALLNESGLSFHPVPGIASRAPSTSFKLPGAETLAVDLLVPGTRAGAVAAVDELGAHAQTIPMLEFLVEEPIDAAILSPNQVVPVRIPSPERFALHKVFSSQSRAGARDKIRKDIDQAALLAAAVEAEMPGRLGDAFRAFPAKGRAALLRGIRPVIAALGDGHEEARAALSALLPGS